MKAVARSYVWWPGIDLDIENCVNSCNTCQVTRNMPSCTTCTKSFVWDLPSKPWSRLHIDFAGPFRGQVFLIVVDARTKWIEVIPVSSMTSSETISRLRSLFATSGLPDQIVSDNGTAFSSALFKQFTVKNGIKHVFSAPFHPATNGQAERSVQSVKLAMRRIVVGDWRLRLARYLFAHRTTPHSLTGITPSEMLMGRKLKTHLDLLHPDLTASVKNKQLDTVSRTVKHVRSFVDQEPVYVRNYANGPKWLPGVIDSVTGPASYLVKLLNGSLWRRHIDQIRMRKNLPTDYDVVIPVQGIVTNRQNNEANVQLTNAHEDVDDEVFQDANEHVNENI